MFTEFRRSPRCVRPTFIASGDVKVIGQILSYSQAVKVISVDGEIDQ